VSGPAAAGLTATALGVSPAAEALLSPTAKAAARLPVLSARNIIDRLLKQQARLAAFSCTLVREEYRDSEPNAAPRVVTGTLKAKPGGRSRYEVGGPPPQQLINDGRSVWMVLPEAKQVFKQDAQALAASGQFFLDLASSIRYYAKTSLARRVPAGGGFGPEVAAIELSPRDSASAGFDRVVVWVDQRRWQPRQAVLYGGGITVRVRFENLKSATLDDVIKDPRRRLPDSIFRYQPPKGWEVFDTLVP
jgi:outer membrane lipoprotein-sorting protein